MSTPPRSAEAARDTGARQNVFLWVNKDSTSLLQTPPTGHVSASINSHVQRWRSKTKASAATYNVCNHKATKDPLLKIRLYQPGQRRIRSESTLSVPAITTSQLPEVSTSTKWPAPQALPPQFKDSTTSDRRLCVNLPNDFQLITANFSSSDCIDPFNCTAISMDYGVQSVLQYYLSFKLEPVFRSSDNEKITATSNAHATAIRSLIQGALFNKLHMYALLSATAGRMKRISHVTFGASNNPEIYLKFALRHLREYLAFSTDCNSLADRQVMLDVFYLSVCEWYLGAPEAARTHLRFLKHFWKDRNRSSSMIDDYLGVLIGYNDIFLAIESRSTPLFNLTKDSSCQSPDRLRYIRQQLARPSRYRQISPSSTLNQGAETAQVATGFSHASINGLYGPLMQAVVDDVVPLAQTLEWTQISSEATPNDRQWVCHQSQTLLHRLASMQCQGPEECCRLALMILLSYISASTAWRSGQDFCMLKMASQLRFHLADDMTGSGQLRDRWCNTEILLWVFVTGAFAARASEDYQWFVVHAMELASMILPTYDGIKVILKRHLYLEAVQEDSVRYIASLLKPT